MARTDLIYRYQKGEAWNITHGASIDLPAEDDAGVSSKIRLLA